MNLRTRILLFVAGCIAVFFGLVVALAQFILLPGADRTEGLAMVQNLRRFSGRLDTRLSRLSQAGTDWAYWNDAGKFIAQQGSAFITENLNAQSFKDSNIDLLVLWDTQDHLVVGRLLRPPAVEPITVSPEFLAELATVPGLFQRVLDGEMVGLTRTTLGIVLLSAQPVSNSNGTGAVRGTLLVGRFLDGNQLAELQAHEPFTAELLPPAAATAELESPLATDADRAAYLQSATTLAGRMPLADLKGGAAGYVTLLAPRTLYRQQVQSIRLVLGALGVGSLVLLVAVGVLVDVLFLRRLFRLQTEVRELRDEDGIKRLEATDGTSEFRQLGRDIAGMARGLRDARLQAEAASRAKSTFLATMSHEIRTPMNGVLGFTSLLKGTPLNAEQKDYVTTIEQSGEILLALINDILDLSKLESGKLELEKQPVILHDLVSEIGVLFSPRLRAKGVTLVIDCANDVPPAVMGDALRLRQILFNLVGNAAKFTHRGEVRVRINRVADASKKSDDECVLLFEVVDTGIGLTPGQLTRLFQPFTQADSSTTRQFGGTGLGLAISQRLVAAMGATIGVASEPDKGARFFFSVRVPFLPASLAHHDEPASDALPTVPKYRGRILVVDDNEVNRRMVSMMLRRLGCGADFAEDGREAVTKATLSSPGYDFVLMDVVMPEMDGLDATRAIRSHELANQLRPAWIVALTASAMLEDRERCQSVGMNDFLAKPVRLGEVIAALERAPPPAPGG